MLHPAPIALEPAWKRWLKAQMFPRTKKPGLSHPVLVQDVKLQLTKYLFGAGPIGAG